MGYAPESRETDQILRRLSRLRHSIEVDSREIRPPTMVVYVRCSVSYNGYNNNAYGSVDGKRSSGYTMVKSTNTQGSIYIKTFIHYYDVSVRQKTNDQEGTIYSTIYIEIGYNTLLQNLRVTSN